VFVIAEAGVNHDGDVKTACALADAALDAGADAVKFQTFRTEALVSRDAPKAAYQERATGGDEGQYEMLRRLELGRADHLTLVDHCARRGIVFFSTPFDDASLDDLVALDVPLLKVPSGEVTNLPFLRRMAAAGRPIVLSTGMSTLDEVARAVDAIRGGGDPPLAILHCVSNYPAAPADTNLRAMDAIRAAFGVPIGLSDHTLGITVAVAAVARGATIIEKHLTLDKRRAGPDHAASLDPGEFRALVEAIRTVESALGDGHKRPAPSELDTRNVARKSLVAARSLAAGQTLTADAIAIKRPGTGISPADLDQAVGRRLRRAVAADGVITWDALEQP
jgi:N-acetylneuraminate synthase/N,N'-diacetyllegionaminate synthase